jgi:Endonuclease/Exonuclease/phosphatase family
MNLIRSACFFVSLLRYHQLKELETFRHPDNTDTRKFVLNATFSRAFFFGPYHLTIISFVNLCITFIYAISMGRNTKGKASNKKKPKNATANSNVKQSASKCWVDRLRFVGRSETAITEQASSNTSPATTISILSWNILAEAYCTRYSHVQLPVQYQKVVFNSTKRKARILQVLEQLCMDHIVDVICLQEVDIPDIQEKMHSLGYSDSAETPRMNGGGAGGRIDACAVYVRRSLVSKLVSTTADSPAEEADGDNASDSDDVGRTIPSSPSPPWQLVGSELVRLDDLATLSSATEASLHLESQHGADKLKSSSCSNIQGMQMSFLRRNVALIVRLRHTITHETIVIANAHLYWNPGFEYVKVCLCIQNSSLLQYNSISLTFLIPLFLYFVSYVKRTTFLNEFNRTNIRRSSQWYYAAT